MKINYKVFLINFVILCLMSCGGKQKAPDQNQIEKIITKDSRPLFIFAPGDYIVELNSSSIYWECNWLGGNKHDGGIYLDKGFISIKDDNKITGSFVVDMNTIDCFDIKNLGTKSKLVNHLKSDDFFDVDEYPNASLEIYSSENVKNNNFLFKGGLTIKGITSSVEMNGEVEKVELGYSANIKLVFDRSKFNVRYRSASFFNDLGDRIISDEVFLNIKIKLNKNIS